MNILKYKYYVLRDDSSGDGGGNYGGYTTGSNQNATDSSQASAAQSAYSSSTPSSGIAGFNTNLPSVDPTPPQDTPQQTIDKANAADSTKTITGVDANGAYTWGDAATPTVDVAAQKDADASPTAAADSGSFTQDQTNVAQASPGWSIGSMFNTNTGSGTNLFANDANNYQNGTFNASSWDGAGYNSNSGSTPANYGGYTTGSSENITSPSQIQSAQNAQDTSTPTSFLGSLLGNSTLGMTKDQFFNQETPAQRDARMGAVGSVIGAIGNTALNVAIPGAARTVMGLANAFNGYQNGSLTGTQAAGRALAGFGGASGVVGNTLAGNYGGAVAGALGLSGVNKGTAVAASLATDAAMGKDVTSQSIGLASYYAGVKLAGPVGGVFAQQLGKDLAAVFRKK